MCLIVTALALGMGGDVLAASSHGASSAAGPDLTGTWTVVNTSGPGAPGTLVITNGRNGAFDGTGYGSYVVKGSVSGSHVHYTVSSATYTSTVDGTLNAGATRITYSWKDQNGAKGTAYLERNGAPPTTTTATNPKTPTGTGNSATSVSCYFDFTSGKDTCTAQVANADGSGPVPTGTVTFTNSGAGSFPAGNKCTLTASADAPGIPFCSVVFLPPDSNLPSITATYSGNGTFSGSSGKTQFAKTGGPAVDVTTPPPAIPDFIPEEGTIFTDVPGDGTTVETSAEEEQAAQSGDEPPNDTLTDEQRADILELTEPVIVISVLSDLDDQEAVLNMETSLHDVVSTENVGAWAADFEEKSEVVYKRLEALQAAGDEESLAEADKLADKYIRMLNYADKAMKIIDKPPAAGGSTKTVDLRYGAASFAGSAAAPKKKEKITVLFRATKSHVHHGSFSTKMHFNRTTLKRLLGKKSTMRIYVTVFMHVPAKGIKGGVPILTIKKLTLKRH